MVALLIAANRAKQMYINKRKDNWSVIEYYTAVKVNKAALRHMNKSILEL